MNYLQAIAVGLAGDAFVVDADHAQALNTVTALLYLTMTLLSQKIGKIRMRKHRNANQGDQKQEHRTED